MNEIKVVIMQTRLCLYIVEHSFVVICAPYYSYKNENAISGTFKIIWKTTYAI